MTNDTKKALEILQPICDEFRLTVGATDEELIFDDDGLTTKIGIDCNSTKATLIEAIGYLFVSEWMCNKRHYIAGTDIAYLIDAVQMYWRKES